MPLSSADLLFVTVRTQRDGQDEREQKNECTFDIHDASVSLKLATAQGLSFLPASNGTIRFDLRQCGNGEGRRASLPMPRSLIDYWFGFDWL